MSIYHINISDIDTQIAHFARAIALPIRVFILRMIAENGNSITRQAFYNSAFNASTINKHILELRALGIVKVKTVKAQATYYIDQHVFDQMFANFKVFFRAVPLQGNIPAQNGLPKPNASLPSDFGRYIKENRTDLNLSQAILARKLDIDRALLSRIETGKKPFDAAKLPLLAQAINLDDKALQLVYEAYTSAAITDQQIAV
ncbi:helix-turn-helix domain-containing protein [Mucilaginibacter sp.]|uniref:helix-turn-helix domain-containing protein n=1 Tax=Mucilaginibacter sp. TaxID=1882438 RepID=UPI0035BBE6EF